MRNRSITILAILLLISIGNFFRLGLDKDIRTVVFLSIFVMGGLFFLLVREVIQRFGKAKAQDL